MYSQASIKPSFLSFCCYPAKPIVTTLLHVTFSKYYKRNLDLFHVRIFGSIAYVQIPNEKQQKLNPKSEKCILVGYSLEQMGYKCFNPSTWKVCISQDVVFNKSTSWYKLGLTPLEPFTNDLENVEYNESQVSDRIWDMPQPFLKQQWGMTRTRRTKNR